MGEIQEEDEGENEETKSERTGLMKYFTFESVRDDYLCCPWE